MLAGSSENPGSVGEQSVPVFARLEITQRR